MKKKFLIISLVIVIILTIFGLRGIINNVVTSKAKDITFKEAPDFELFDINGNPVRLSDFKGKVIILDFWATWCPYCKKAIPHFIELYDEYRNEGLEIIGISMDWNEDEKVLSFAKKMGINYIVLLADRHVADLYGGIMSVPTTFVIDREGRIVKRYMGYREKETFERDIEGLL